MTTFIIDATWIRLAGLAGGLVVVLTSLAAALVYRGKRGERYSPLNHFISELGELGVSHLARVFNAGLILGGILFLPFGIGLGLLIPGVWSKLGLAAGVVAAVSLALVGVFPMNNLKPHSLAAMTYFRAGLAMVILFTLAIALQVEGAVVVPRAVNWAGLFAILAFGSFLVIARVASKQVGDILDPEAKVSRPRFWLMPAVEWMIFVSTLVWFGVVSLGVGG